MTSLQEASVTTFDAIEIRMAVGDGHMFIDRRGEQFAVEYVTRRAVVYEGRLFDISSLHGATETGARTNYSIHHSLNEPVPTWLPTPPPEFTALVDVLRTAVES